MRPRPIIQVAPQNAPGDIMKTHLPLTLATLLILSGCPDNKVPKAPPKAPEPKADTALSSPPATAVQAALAAQTPGGLRGRTA